MKTWSPHCKNLAFKDPPSLNFHNRTDATTHPTPTLQRALHYLHRVPCVYKPHAILDYLTSFFYANRKPNKLLILLSQLAVIPSNSYNVESKEKLSKKQTEIEKTEGDLNIVK